jgi:hypothetical protein
MTLEKIVGRIMAEKGWDAAADPMVRRVTIIALKALQKRRVITAAQGKPIRWTITL